MSPAQLVYFTGCLSILRFQALKKDTSFSLLVQLTDLYNRQAASVNVDMSVYLMDQMDQSHKTWEQHLCSLITTLSKHPKSSLKSYMSVLSHVTYRTYIRSRKAYWSNTNWDCEHRLSSEYFVLLFYIHIILRSTNMDFL